MPQLAASRRLSDAELAVERDARRFLKPASSGSSSAAVSASTAGAATDASSQLASCLNDALKLNFGNLVVGMKREQVINRATMRQEIELATHNFEYQRYWVLRMVFHFTRSGMASCEH